ncbi:MAG: hypothetical protein JF886_10360 [Candidatus Dormibacteraeota bacterium]|uniref:ABM domain-containing protein n=1 Tax=Candidatus Aeolococcus gillhamiae TaxID=3127015 RepID=A0A2W6AL25_9BACT|nr:hypothetical protein [Candidatus Dormibacteraeota bacterium]PZR78431.1 MAG: hypothetical protein DLM65_13050 [Candidatus Dormibacter sp. RRmetagenome_bin12]
MAELLVLEFDGFGEDVYRKVNEALGIDPENGDGDWPAGMITHAGGKTPTGWIVVEVWDSRESQEKFMNERLGAALQQGGVQGPPKKADWTSLTAHHQPNKGKAATG